MELRGAPCGRGPRGSFLIMLGISSGAPGVLGVIISDEVAPRLRPAPPYGPPGLKGLSLRQVSVSPTLPPHPTRSACLLRVYHSCHLYLFLFFSVC